MREVPQVMIRRLARFPAQVLGGVADGDFLPFGRSTQPEGRKT